VASGKLLLYIFTSPATAGEMSVSGRLHVFIVVCVSILTEREDSSSYLWDHSIKGKIWHLPNNI